jgi:hemerythrin
MSVGVAEFDKNHQHMLLLLREIAAALLKGDRERARSQANKLQTLAADHTAREEAFLRRIGFPGLEAVMAVQHESLSRIVALKDATPEEGSNPIASTVACRQSMTPGAEMRSWLFCFWRSSTACNVSFFISGLGVF